MKVVNADVLAEGLEKCRLLNKLLVQILEKLDVYGCPKLQNPDGEGKTDSSWICSRTLSDTKQGFTVPRGKKRCMENGLRNI